MSLAHPKHRSLEEERVNAITHGVASLLSFIGLNILLYYAVTVGDRYQIIGSLLFGISLTFMYASSTRYHWEQEEARKATLRVYDHISIYLLIAGTYSLVALTALRGPLGWTLLGIQWGLAAIGTIVKRYFRARFKLISLGGYILMGWLIVFAIKPLSQALSPEEMKWLFAGGVFYTLGTPFYALDRRKPYFHSIWHLFVMAGSACHFMMGLVLISR